MVTYSVMVYYTPQFKAVTDDIDLFVDLRILETNQGYANSNVPVRIKKHCIERAGIDDMGSAKELFRAFKRMKPTIDELVNTADVAVLLFRKGGSGIGIFNSVVNYVPNISVMGKWYAENRFTFGHEIGHNFGLGHNREVEKHAHSIAHGHGHLIGNGFTTIMAYPGKNLTRTNYYSNPAVNFPFGPPTGIRGISNNAAVLISNRFIMAATGDETSVCKGKPGNFFFFFMILIHIY